MRDYKFQDEYPVEKMNFESFCQYQDFTATTDKAGTDLNCILGLMGECGEIAEKVKKITRKAHTNYPYGTCAINFNCAPFTPESRKELAKEVGDVLWYASRLADKLGYRLGDIIRMNVEKLSSRKDRGILHGSGDNR
jgi:NTP pyrophosphatase (non-canonical NTP hydrolase)